MRILPTGRSLTALAVASTCWAAPAIARGNIFVHTFVTTHDQPGKQAASPTTQASTTGAPGVELQHPSPQGTSPQVEQPGPTQGTAQGPTVEQTGPTQGTAPQGPTQGTTQGPKTVEQTGPTQGTAPQGPTQGTSPRVERTGLQVEQTGPQGAAQPTSPPPEIGSPARSGDPPETNEETPRIGKLKVGGYGGPLVKLTMLNRQFGAFVGLRGGVLLGRYVSLGAALHYLMLPVHIDPATPDPVRVLNLNYAGAAIGIVFARPRKRLVFEAMTLLGGGGSCLQNKTQGTCEDRNGFFVAEPELYMHVRVAEYFRISIGAGYRFIAATAWSGPGSWRLAGPVGTVMLAFGRF